ncbi:hypothetical protein BSQ44_06875 [Aquibium oceanicum]|uniref:Transposase DDE domain-containing protein n=1 Tax=Aquibium oceanicum TaxID=1670800 RepID=A0A1L3SNZ3_9HYPH|nr:hypothetical protein BSQ44_06875 [Aquibium oceanicum]
MAVNATGDAESGPLRLKFDLTVKLAFCCSSISSDGGLLLHRDLDDALGLTGLATDLLADPRTGKNGRHDLAALLRQSIFSRFAGYEDVNDAYNAALVHALCGERSPFSPSRAGLQPRQLPATGSAAKSAISNAGDGKAVSGAWLKSRLWVPKRPI